MPFLVLLAQEVSDNNSEIYHTITDRKKLEKIWSNWRRNRGDWPFLCADVKCREQVSWVKSSKGRTFVRHKPGSKCVGDKIRHQDPDGKHVLIQRDLVRIGRKLGQLEARMEWPVNVDGRTYRFDVVWPESSICWEVDLTINPESEQRLREEIRKAIGFRMISIVDGKKLGSKSSKGRRIKALDIETVVLINTDFTKSNRYSLDSCWLKYIRELPNDNDHTNFCWRKNFTFLEFARTLLTKDPYRYESPRAYYYVGHWMRESDWEKIRRSRDSQISKVAEIEHVPPEEDPYVPPVSPTVERTIDDLPKDVSRTEFYSEDTTKSHTPSAIPSVVPVRKRSTILSRIKSFLLGVP